MNKLVYLLFLVPSIAFAQPRAPRVPYVNGPPAPVVQENNRQEVRGNRPERRQAMQKRFENLSPRQRQALQRERMMHRMEVRRILSRPR